MIKPIETSYKGYLFRSRLEARWAVFFDDLGIDWEYENEGYDLGEFGWYLPDFWLPRTWNGLLVEIKQKGYQPNNIGSKYKALAIGGKNICLFAGDPYDLIFEEKGQFIAWDIDHIDGEACYGMYLPFIIMGLAKPKGTAQEIERYVAPVFEKAFRATKKARSARF